MATLTTNLFHGQGELDHALSVVAGAWPEDLHGTVFVVGPDKREPGGHWFAEHGLVEAIALTPGADGCIGVRHRRVRTPMERLRRRLPFLFARIQFAVVSPFGVTNLANTNVTPIGDRLFVGYDAGRPVEIDPVTLEYLTPVGANDEWLQGAPGMLEPLCAVAAHPAPDFEESALYFVNYAQVTPPGVPAETHVARWRLDGPVERWRVAGMSAFDSIHDAKVTEHHIVFTDLPFVIEPGLLTGKPRTQRIQDHTKLWIIPKAALDETAPGGIVPATEVRLPMPTGHLFVDHTEVDGIIRVVVQHIPLGDLLLTFDEDTVEHRGGTVVDPAYAGMIPAGVQPSVVGCYEIDPATGVVKVADVAHDASRVWGGVLPTTDSYRADARARHRNLWYAGVGYDPDLVPESWWALYHDAVDGLVAPPDLPEEAVPGSLARFDLEAMEVADVWTCEPGTFPSPPTFVPRRGASGPDDGYVVVIVHRDGPKEVQVFDAADLASGPVAVASSPTFNPNLMLHSCWMPDRKGPRPSRYAVPVRRDVRGALAGMPGVLARYVRMGATMVRTRGTGPQGA